MRVSRFPYCIILVLFILSNGVIGQSIIDIPHTPTPEGITWPNAEKQYFSALWQTPVVTNVSIPRLIHYKADPSKDKGAAIIICPGGGFHALSIESEGKMLATWLAERGISSFILKYRLVPSGEDGVREYQEKSMKGEGRELTGQLIKLSIADGVSAVDYVRKNATSLGVNPDMIGVIGFSAGGTVTAGTAFMATPTTMPTFIAPIYGYLSPFDEMPFPENAPPLFVSAASDDPLQLAPHSAKIYSRWIENKKPAEIHMYSKGGHGYGLRKNNNVSDTWVDRFGDWLGSMGWL